MNDRPGKSRQTKKIAKKGGTNLRGLDEKQGEMVNTKRKKTNLQQKPGVHGSLEVRPTTSAGDIMKRGRKRRRFQRKTDPR